MTTPTPEAQAAVDALERDDDKPWDEDFKLALALAFDAFAAQRVALERLKREAELHCVLGDPSVRVHVPPADWGPPQNVAAQQPATPAHGHAGNDLERARKRTELIRRGCEAQQSYCMYPKCKGTCPADQFLEAAAIVFRFNTHRLNATDISQDSPYNVLIEEVADALAAARTETWEAAAQYHEQQYIDVRDNSPRSSEGLHTAIAGAHMAAHRESMERFRALAGPDARAGGEGMTTTVVNFNLKYIEDEISRICQILETTVNPTDRAFLMAAYQALNWARSPEAFAPPSEMIKTPRPNLKIVSPET